METLPSVARFFLSVHSWIIHSNRGILMRSHPLAIALVAAFVLSTAACSPAGDDQSAGILAPASETFLVGDRNDNYTVRLGLVNVCAFWTGSSTPFSATFSASASGGTVLAGNFSIFDPPPLCMEVWNSTGSATTNVSASLLSTASGWQLDRIVTLVSNNVDESTGAVVTGASSASVSVSDVKGGYIWFKFAPRLVPPPPGGQGCTPGYWKQSQHFGSWTSPYTPGTLFSSAFSSTAFGRRTLLQVLELGGGGMRALGRHAVAALLNAASPSVSYDMTVAQVISSFNSAADGSAGAIETQKNLFDMLNNQGCPLGLNP